MDCLFQKLPIRNLRGALQIAGLQIIDEAPFERKAGKEKLQALVKELRGKNKRRAKSLLVKAEQVEEQYDTLERAKEWIHSDDPALRARARKDLTELKSASVSPIQSAAKKELKRAARIEKAYAVFSKAVNDLEGSGQEQEEATKVLKQLLRSPYPNVKEVALEALDMLSAEQLMHPASDNFSLNIIADSREHDTPDIISAILQARETGWCQITLKDESSYEGSLAFKIDSNVATIINIDLETSRTFNLNEVRSVGIYTKVDEDSQ